MLSSPKELNAKEVSNFFEELNLFCESQKSNKMVYFGIEDICNVSFSETFRALVDFDFSNNTIKNLLVSHVESLEKYSPLSAAYLPYFLNHLYSNEINLEHDAIFNLAEPVKKEHVDELIECYFENSSLLKTEDYKQIFEKNGFISSFSLKKSNSFHNACVYDSGITILSKINFGFYQKTKVIEFESPQVIVYDGFIQEVSELNKILSFSNEKDIPFVVFCKGASIDVLHTCFVNFNMGKCKVVVCEPHPDFWKEQKENICSSFSIIPFGYETGKLLNTFEIENEFNISVRIHQNEVFIKSKNLDLKDKAKTSIYLNESSWGKKGIIFDQLNFFTSTLQQLATCGVLNSKKLDDYLGLNLNDCTGLYSEHHPAFPVARALKEAQNTFDKIVNIGCLIKLEG